MRTSGRRSIKTGTRSAAGGATGHAASCTVDEVLPREGRKGRKTRELGAARVAQHARGPQTASASLNTRATRAPRLRLSVQHAIAADGLPVAGTLRRWLSRALAPKVTMAISAATATIVLRFVGSSEGRRLNRDFRARDYATNVLTFVYDRPAASGENALAGDIVLCVPVLKREARALDRSLRAHCAHLVIHGALHLQGYDHESDKDARVMEALETELLASFGYRDPYEIQENRQDI